MKSQKELIQRMGEKEGCNFMNGTRQIHTCTRKGNPYQRVLIGLCLIPTCFSLDEKLISKTEVA